MRKFNFNWFFKISEFTDKIRKNIESDEFKILPDERKNEVLGLLKSGFHDVAISRPNVKWGIPLPWDKQQTVYVWIDALINYISGIGFLANQEQFQKFWPADWHVIGKDIIKFHCIIWPALLLAADLPMPKGVFAHGYLTVNEQKISKSLGNVIDPNDWVAKYGSDAVRYFLLREVPFGQDGDVSEEKLKARYESDLANGLGNLVSRVTRLIVMYADEKIVAKTVNFDFNQVDKLIEDFKFHEALAKLWEAVSWANKIVDENKLWELGKNDKEKFKNISSELVYIIDQIGIKLKPFMPETALKIPKMLDVDHIDRIEHLFPRID